MIASSGRSGVIRDEAPGHLQMDLRADPWSLADPFTSGGAVRRSGAEGDSDTTLLGLNPSSSIFQLCDLWPIT